jgi:hypothetical protein
MLIRSKHTNKDIRRKKKGGKATWKIKQEKEQCKMKRQLNKNRKENQRIKRNSKCERKRKTKKESYMS